MEIKFDPNKIVLTEAEIIKEISDVHSGDRIEARLIALSILYLIKEKKNGK